jgi:hypothetical protein
VPIDAPVSRRVIINELMPDPYGDDTFKEWFELHNPSGEAIDMSGWVVRDCGSQALTLFGPRARIEAGAFRVFGASADRDENGDTPVDYGYGPTNLYLPNTVGSLLLFDGPDPTAELIDQVRYSRFGPWSDVFRSGHSLERKGGSSDGTAATSWQRGSRAYGDGDDRGSPGRRNGN